MRRIATLGLVVTAILCLPSARVEAELIFDSFNGLNQTANSFTTTGSFPRNLMGDDLSTIATPIPGYRWRVDSLSLRVFAAGSGVAGQNVVYDAVTMRVRVYETFTAGITGTPTPVFSNLVSEVNWNLGTVTNASATGGAVVFTYNLPYDVDTRVFELATGQNIGVTVSLLSNNAIVDGLATAAAEHRWRPWLTRNWNVCQRLVQRCRWRWNPRV